MSLPDGIARGLHAYYDGELGWLAKWRFERRLGRSAELREELESLRLLNELTAETESHVRLAAGSLWQGIEGRLRAVDAELDAAEFAAPAVAGRPAWLGWRPIGAAALAGAGALALVLAVLQPGTGPVAGEAIASGTVRYLDTGDRSVVVHDRDDVTIIWVMGSATEDV